MIVIDALESSCCFYYLFKEHASQFSYFLFFPREELLYLLEERGGQGLPVRRLPL